MKSNTIFISIAAYCDEPLAATVQDALNKAKYPDKLRFGIVEQRELSKRLVLTKEQRKTIRYTGIDPVESRGLNWARACCMALYCGEDWFFQIDAHMVFEQDWDEWFVNKAIECLEFSNKPIISSYPKSYTLVNGQPKIHPEQGVKAHVIRPMVDAANFKPDNYTLAFEAILINTVYPLPGFHMGCGCMFTSGRFVYEMPYDPQFYFEGEEQALAVKAYTHGWDILHVPNMPIYHLYARETRLSHWEGNADAERGDNWWVLKEQAIKRLTQLVSGEDLGIYSLGTKRSLKDYADFCGIDYTTATLNEKAFRGPWIQVLE